MEKIDGETVQEVVADSASVLEQVLQQQRRSRAELAMEYADGCCDCGSDSSLVLAWLVLVMLLLLVHSASLIHYYCWMRMVNEHDGRKKRTKQRSDDCSSEAAAWQ